MIVLNKEDEKTIRMYMERISSILDKQMIENEFATEKTVLRCASEAVGINVKDIKKVGPFKNAHARWLAYYYFVHVLKYNLIKAGEVLNQDHTTVLQGIKKLKEYVESGDIEINAYRTKFIKLINQG